MANKPKSENYDALGSIFDFIFQEADKPANQRRSIKPTGISGEKELTDAIFAALEKPGAFMSNTVVDEFNGALDYEIAKIPFDEIGAVKLTANSVVDLLRDPAGYIEKAVNTNKAIRRSQRAKFLGATMEDFVTTAWAQKYGDLEAKAAVRGTIAANDAESYKIRRALGQYGASHSGDEVSPIQGTRTPGRFSLTELDFMAKRSADLLGRQVFSNWDSMGKDERFRFTEMISGGKKRLEIRSYLENKYGLNSPEVANFSASMIDPTTNKVVVKEEEEVTIFDPKLYKPLEERNIKNKIKSLGQPAPGTPEAEEKRIYQKTLYLLKHNKKNIQIEIERIKRDLRSTSDPTQKKELEQELKDAKEALRIEEGHTFFGRIGQFEGYINSLNNTYGGVLGTNVVPSILKGDFFDENKNTLFNPVTKKKVGGVEILVEKEKFTREGREVVMQPLHRKYNKWGANIYYLTPRSIVRTLFYNGEGFAYLLHNRLESIRKSPEFSALTKLGIDLNEAFNRDDIDVAVSEVISKAAAVLRPDQLAKFEKALNGSKSLKKLTHAFSHLSRIQAKINDYFKDKLSKARHFIVDKIILKNPKLKAYLIRVGAEKLLKTWAAKGGIHVFIRSLVTAIVAALGLTMTPLVSFIVGVVTWILTDLAMKLVGLGLNIAKYVVLGLIAIFLLVVIWGTGGFVRFNKINYASSQTIPGTVVSCTQYEEQELDTGWEDEWGDSRVAPPPSGEQCIMGTGNIYCTQGYRDTQGWSHQNMASRLPVDLVYISSIYAPQFCELSKGNCFVTRIAKINCGDGTNAGGIVEYSADDGKNVHHFKLLHVQPYDGVSEGTKLFGGQAVAHVQTNLEQGWCWTGTHLHLETTQNGVPVDPLKLLQGFNCNVPDETGCADP